MATVVEKLISQGHTSLLVWVISTNPYRAFYESLGGEAVDAKEVERAGVTIPEIAYGWHDFSIFENILKEYRKQVSF